MGQENLLRETRPGQVGAFGPANWRLCKLGTRRINFFE
ncbi:unnamed protein product [Spirodela intermedia]|uniref:Uncharacterized protein n=1 Tax=Spirodela intermedia TaxID=51605 RepID=A0A7I8KK47_SPIIN|nr:unnamed protein product [Spirodela intermedia]